MKELTITRVRPFPLEPRPCAGALPSSRCSSSTTFPLGTVPAQRLRPTIVEEVRELEILGGLSRGGMGQVSLVRRHGGSGARKLFALKRILPGLSNRSSHYEQMFLNEARIAASMRHPGICETLDVGHCDGGYYILMEYLEGLSFSDLWEKRRSRTRLASVRFVGSLVEQAAVALDYMHSLTDEHGDPLNLVHRDVSPSNVFVTWHGDVKILDFGLAQARGGESVERRTFAGKLRYMSPEQLRGDSVDGRSDVFSLGVILYELITGRALFPYDGVRGPIPDVRTFRPDLSGRLASVCARALADRPGHRLGSALEFADALNAALAPLGGAMTRRRISQELTAAVPERIRRGPEWCDGVAQPRPVVPPAHPSDDTELLSESDILIVEETDHEGCESIAEGAVAPARSDTVAPDPTMALDPFGDAAARPGLVTETRNRSLIHSVLVVAVVALALVAGGLFIGGFVPGT